MPNCRLTVKGRGNGRFGGRLICFCKPQSTAYSSPDEVCCSKFTGEMLKNWKRTYKNSNIQISAPQDLTDSDLSTPIGLANFYRQLIKNFGFKSAAFALEVAKFWSLATLPEGTVKKDKIVKQNKILQNKSNFMSDVLFCACYFKKFIVALPVF